MIDYHGNAIEATAGLYSMTTSHKTKPNHFAAKLLNLAKISGWCLDVFTGELECTRGLYDIYHYDSDSVITTERLIQTCLQEDREIWTDLHSGIKRFNDSPALLQQDLNKYIINGERRRIVITEDNTFEVEYRIVVPGESGPEQIRWIHCHGEIEYETTDTTQSINLRDSPTDADLLLRATQQASKKVRAVIAAIQDISKFKLQSLFDLPSATVNTKSEHEFRLLVESIPQKVFTTDANGNADYFNSKWLAYCGFSLGETVNRGWTISVHPEDLPELLKQWEACVRAGQSFEKKFRLKCAIDGLYRWHLTRAVVVRSNDGHITSYIGTATDIHDQQLAEDKARAAEVYLKSVISNFPVLVMVTDHTGLCTLCEGKGLEVVGLQQSWFLNKTFYETMAQLGTNQYIDYYKRGLSGERFSAELTFNNHILECHFAPFFPDLEHHAPGLIVVAKDITIRKEAARLAISEASAREAAMLKSEFLATMSHEMRTPLNGIIGMTELLADTHLDEEQKRYLDTVQNSSTHLLMLINDILDLSKIDAGKIELENIEFTVRQLIDNQLNMFGVALKNKLISMSVEIDDEINKSSFVGDEGRIGQILTNLVSNAIKFTPAQGTISVKAMRAVKESGGKYTKVKVPEQSPELAEAINAGDEAIKPTDIIFTVHDSGIGISKEVQQRLFQPFTQANNSTRRKYGGTGLGLSICKKLVAVMHGEIGVESEEGKGSTFWFTIPLRSVSTTTSPNLDLHDKDEKSELNFSQNKQYLGVPPNVKVQLTKSFSFTQQAHVNPSQTTRPHILVVEDHPVNQALMVGMLRKMGCEIEVANDGQEAYNLVTIQHKQYDLIFMDCYMPELDGYTATRMLREYEFTMAAKNRSLTYKHTPIIAVTANALLGDREKCFDAGMSDYLSKPITKKSVVNIMKKWLPNANVDF